MVVVDNFFDWRLSSNSGSAFSMFQGGTLSVVILSIVAAIALGGVIWLVKRTGEGQRGAIAAYGLIAGGAAGNLFDRVTAGAVTDFVSWRYYDNLWPIFNVADALLLIGVALLFIHSFASAPAADPAIDA